MPSYSVLFLALGIIGSINISHAEDISQEIYRGYNAKPGQFPYHALLSITDAKRNKFTCGGSLISRQYILTAAHCINGGVQTIVKLGITNTRNTTNTVSLLVNQSNMIVHPNYKPSSTDYDIAILKLPSQVTTNSKINIINLPKKAWADPATFDNYNVTLTGFGGVVDDDPQTPHQYLQFTNIHKMPQAACISTYAKKDLSVNSRNICTDKTVYSGPCPGDSGGPLTVRLTSGLFEIGLVSWGVDKPDCSARTPEVYTNVAAFLQWINSVTGIPIS